MHQFTDTLRRFNGATHPHSAWAACEDPSRFGTTLGEERPSLIHVVHALPIGPSISLLQSELREPGLAIIRVTHQGCRFRDVSTIAAATTPSWSKLVLILRGTAEAVVAGRVVRLEPGDGYVSPEWSTDPVRALSPNVDGVRIVWLPPRLERPRCSDTFRGGSSLATAVMAALDHATLPSDPTAASRVLNHLRTLGVFRHVERNGPLLIHPAEQRFAKALAARILPLGERPAVVDLATELGWSERSTLRMSQRFFGAYFPAACGHWRRYLRMWRLNAAATLLSTEDLSVGEVSARVGFSSPTSLCHALEQAGWPSAGAIRREFDQ